eukprot:TCALIF_04231-PA protein Name:"Similar to MINOS1 Mitochondrial inner membrane organizing system protein 1 (Homo sapiens)" AED:0.24 eAED:0.24 QI:321/1/0.5/1/0/0/2/0/51
MRGATFSLFLFKRRAWPVIFGTGSGFGMAYSNCQNAFNSAFSPATPTPTKK